MRPDARPREAARRLDRSLSRKPMAGERPTRVTGEKGSPDLYLVRSVATERSGVPIVADGRASIGRSILVTCTG